MRKVRLISRSKPEPKVWECDKCDITYTNVGKRKSDGLALMPEQVLHKCKRTRMMSALKERPLTAES